MLGFVFEQISLYFEVFGIVFKKILTQSYFFLDLLLYCFLYKLDLKRFFVSKALILWGKKSQDKRNRKPKIEKGKERKLKNKRKKRRQKMQFIVNIEESIREP